MTCYQNHIKSLGALGQLGAPLGALEGSGIVNTRELPKTVQDNGFGHPISSQDHIIQRLGPPGLPNRVI